MDARPALLAIACMLLVAACDIGSVPPPRFPDASPADAAPDAPDAGLPDAFALSTTAPGTAPR